MTKSPTTTTTNAPATTWAEFAATYRNAVASYLEAIKVDESEAQDRANQAYTRAFSALLAYPVTTPAQLAEKIDLVWLVEPSPADVEQIEQALKRDAAAAASFSPVGRGRGRDLTHDLISAGCRVEASPALRVWMEREAAWVESVAAMRADPTDEALDAEAATWGLMMETEAPSLRALLMKLEAVLACHLSEAGTSLRSPEAIAALADDCNCMGPGPLLAMWRDLQRLTGVSEPISPEGA